MKNNTMRAIFAIAIVASFLSTGCKTRLTDFTMISTKTLDISQMGTYKRGPARIQGEDMAYFILIAPTGVPNLKEAIDDGISKVPGAVALVDGVVYSYNIYAVFFAKYGYIVEGTPLIDPKQAVKAGVIKAAPSKYMVSVPTQDKKSELAYLTKADYEKVQVDVRTNNVEDAIAYIQRHKLN
jgi:hypothetical protein